MDLEPRHLLWALAGAALLAALLAGWAEHRRTRRRDLDRPGLVPWNAIQILALIAALAAAAVALKG